LKAEKLTHLRFGGGLST